MSKIILYQLIPRLFGNRKKEMTFNGSRKQNGCGKFSDINDEALKQLKEFGVTHIWFTGIFRHAKIEGYPECNIKANNPYFVKGKAGSPYAIVDYFDVDPDLGDNVENRINEFRDLVKKTHRSKLKVIIDFVPNHVSREYKSINKPRKEHDLGFDDDKDQAFSANNNFYYIPYQQLQLSEEIEEKVLKDYPDSQYFESPARVTGNDKFTAYIDKNDWYETVKLNYGINYQDGTKHFHPIPDTWKRMYKILKCCAKNGVDGFRCDMAEMVPVEFWNWVIAKIKRKYRKIIFIAEIYKPELYSSYINFGGFDYLYDKVGLYNTLRNVLCNNESASSITRVWQKLNGNDAYMLRFLENHDEQRIASRFFCEKPEKAFPAIVVSLFLNKGPFMLYFGQEVGEEAKGASGFSGDDGRTTIFDYYNVPAHQKWMNNGLFDGRNLNENQKEIRLLYKQLIEIANTYDSVKKGRFYDIMWENENVIAFSSDKIYAFLRYTKKERMLFVVNFNDTDNISLHIFIPQHAFHEMNFLPLEAFEIKSLMTNKTYNFSVYDIINTGIPITLKKSGYEILIF